MNMLITKLVHQKDGDDMIRTRTCLHLERDEETIQTKIYLHHEEGNVTIQTGIYRHQGLIVVTRISSEIGSILTEVIKPGRDVTETYLRQEEELTGKAMQKKICHRQEAANVEQTRTVTEIQQLAEKRALA